MPDLADCVTLRQWRLPQWLPFSKIWLQEGYIGGTIFHELGHLYPLLLADSASSISRTDTLRLMLGSVCYHWYDTYGQHPIIFQDTADPFTLLPIGPAYASEVCPLALRGYLTCYVNLCWAIGQLIAAGVLYGLLPLEGQWSYRVCYALQWVWPIPLLCIILFGPESPWYLIRNDRVEDAYKSLAKLDNKGVDSHRRTIAQIMHTLRIEDQISSGTNYLDCFRGVDLRRTEIVCMTFAAQVLSVSLIL